jgi:hypothetical protein
VSYKTLLRAAAAFFITLICWSLTNPPGSTHDEWFHLGSIWCANGVDREHCTDRYPGGGIADIDTSSCIFPLNTEIRSCSEIVPGGYMVRSDNYPNGFYQVMKFFIPLGNSLNVLSMRVFNGLVASILLLVQIILLKPKHRTAWLGGFTLTLVPLGIFLVSSVHPSGWGLTACAHGWMFLITAITSDKSDRKKQIGAFVGWFLCGAMCLASRYDIFGFFLVTSAIASIFAMTPEATSKHRFKLTTILLVLSSAGFFVLNQFVKNTSSLNLFRTSPGDYDNKTWVTAWLIRAVAIPVEILGTGQIAHRGIVMPPIVWILGIAVVAPVLIFSLIGINLRQIGVLATSIVLLFFAVLSFNQLMYRDLEHVNGRYIIPLLPAMIGLVVHTSKSSMQFLEIREFRLVTISILGLAHSISLHTVLDVFVDGQSFSFLPLTVGDTGWWWVGLPIGPNFVWLLGSLSFIQFLRKIWSLVPYVDLSLEAPVAKL